MEKADIIEFPIFTKDSEEKWFSKLISPTQSICVDFASESVPKIRFRHYGSTTTTEWDWYVSKRDVQSTQDEFIKAYNKVIEKTNSHEI